MNGSIKAIALKDLPERGAVRVELMGQDIALVRCEGRIYALGDICPHQGGPLSSGTVGENFIRCPWHAWEFSLNNGRCLAQDDFAVPVYAVTKRDGFVWVDLSNSKKSPEDGA